MADLFVYPVYKHHAPYRKITRETDLDFRLLYIPRNIPDEVAFPETSIFEGKMPARFETQQQVDYYFRESGGVDLCNGYMHRGFRTGGFRLHRYPPTWGLDPVALEPLAYGVGILREKKTKQVSALDAMLGNPAQPKISSHHMKILMHHIINFGSFDPERPWLPIREIYESTNLILADSYGELEQLLRRRHESEFVKRYLEHMKEITEFKHSPYFGMEVPAGFSWAPAPLVFAWLRHRELGLWQEPPQSENELIERVDFLLSNILIDEKPSEIVTDYNHRALYFNRGRK